MEKKLVVIHQEEEGEIPTVYFNSDQVDVLWVCDFVPDDRIYRMSGYQFPKHLLDDIAKEPAGSIGDGSLADAEAYSLVYGTKPPNVN